MLLARRMARRTARQVPLTFTLRERFTLDHFIVGGNAELAARVCRPVDGFFCTWVWGRSGAGKSHLLQAVSHETGGAFVPATQIPGVNGYEVFDRVLIDDIHAWIGDRAAEEALLRLYNNRLERGLVLVATARKPPTQLCFALPDLASRLRSSACFEISPPSDEEASAVLRRVAQDRGFDLDARVVSFLLRRTGRDLADLLRLLETIDVESLSAQRRITVPFVKQVLEL